MIGNDDAAMYDFYVNQRFVFFLVSLRKGAIYNCHTKERGETFFLLLLLLL